MNAFNHHVKPGQKLITDEGYWSSAIKMKYVRGWGVLPGGGREPEEGGRARPLERMGGPPSFMLGAGEPSGDAAFDVVGESSCNRSSTFSTHQG